MARALRTTTNKIEVWERLIITAFVVTLLVFAARATHLLAIGEAWWLDRMAGADRPEFNAPIVVVAITDECFYHPDLFGGRSPLDPDALARIVKRILEHRPRGVILDVLIHPAPGESPDRAAARVRLFRLLEQAAETTPTILVREFESEERERRADQSGWPAFDELTASRRLVWATPSIRRPGAYVRAVPHWYEDAGGDAPNLPTVLGAAVTAFELEAYRSRPWWVHHEESDPTLPWRIRFSGHFLNIGSSLTPHHVTVASVLSQPVVEGSQSQLTDKIVLIGGTYHAGRDIRPTVVGDMAGVCVWAEAIASWIRHDALREPLEIISFTLEFIIGIVAGLLLVRFGPALGLLLALLIVSPLTVIFSLFTFGDKALFVNFLPSFVGVYLHYQIEVHWEIRNLKKEVARLLKKEPPKKPDDLQPTVV